MWTQFVSECINGCNCKWSLWGIQLWIFFTKLLQITSLGRGMTGIITSGDDGSMLGTAGSSSSSDLKTFCHVSIVMFGWILTNSSDFRCLLPEITRKTAETESDKLFCEGNFQSTWDVSRACVFGDFCLLFSLFCRKSRKSSRSILLCIFSSFPRVSRAPAPD